MGVVASGRAGQCGAAPADARAAQCGAAFADGSLPRGAGSASAARCEAVPVPDRSLLHGAGSASAARCEAFPVADQSLPRGAGASDSDLKSLRLRIENDMIEKTRKALMQFKSSGDRLERPNQWPKHWKD